MLVFNMDCRGGRAPDIVTARTQQNEADAAESAKTNQAMNDPDISEFCGDAELEDEESDMEMDNEGDESTHRYSNHALIEGAQARPGECKACQVSINFQLIPLPFESFILKLPRPTCGS